MSFKACLIYSSAIFRHVVCEFPSSRDRPEYHNCLHLLHLN